MTAQIEIPQCRPWRAGPSIYCSAEWHLRGNPCAIAIYTLALHLSNGSKVFFLSQPQVAQYFDWSLSTVKRAFRALEKSKLFVLLHKGRGGDVRCPDFANVYQVLTHNELPKAGVACYVKPEKSTQGQKQPEVKNDPTPRVKNDPSPRVKNDPLVSDVSTKKSTNPDDPVSAPDGATDLSVSRVDEDKALDEVWQHYLTATDRNPKLNTFTVIRKRKGLARLRECLAKTKGNLENAVKLMKLAIDKLAQSDWHMGRDPKTNGKKYADWESHVFKSLEQIEGWWQR